MSTREDAERLHAAGASIREVARTLGLPHSTVQRWLGTSEPRSQEEIMAESRDREVRAVALWKDGLSASKIADEVGVSKMQVTRLLRRAGVMTALLLVAGVAFAPRVDAHVTVGQLVAQARGSAWDCDFDHDGRWGPKQNRCVVRVTFQHEPRVGREAEMIVSCESQWDEQNRNASTASGLAQFLDSTWRRTPYRRRSVFHPVWNVRAMQWLYHHDGESWREWSCARIVGV